MAGPSFGTHLRAVVGKCLDLGLVGLLGGAPDVVVNELLGCSRQRRGVLAGVMLVPDVWVLGRDPRVVALLLASFLLLRLLLRLLYGDLVAAHGLQRWV